MDGWVRPDAWTEDAPISFQTAADETFTVARMSRSRPRREQDLPRHAPLDRFCPGHRPRRGHPCPDSFRRKPVRGVVATRGSDRYRVHREPDAGTRPLHRQGPTPLTRENTAGHGPTPRPGARSAVRRRCGAQVKERAESADESYMANSQLKTRPGIAYRGNREGAGTETHRGEIAAVVVERTDGTCTVLWAGLWRTFNSKPEEWQTRREAMTAVDTVVGEILIWNEMAPHTWAARAHLHALGPSDGTLPEPPTPEPSGRPVASPPTRVVRAGITRNANPLEGCAGITVEPHSESNHDAPGHDVLRLVDADDIFEAEDREPMGQGRSGPFGRQPPAPHGGIESPPDFDRRHELGEKVRLRQADVADEATAGTVLGRPFDLMPPLLVFDPASEEHFCLLRGKSRARTGTATPRAGRRSGPEGRGRRRSTAEGASARLQARRPSRDPLRTAPTARSRRRRKPDRSLSSSPVDRVSPTRSPRTSPPPPTSPAALPHSCWGPGP